MATLLWIIAVVLVIAGVYVLIARRDILWGVVLIVVGLLVGPGGVSIFNP
ncbi:GPGG-motif small membrane protein [Nonomuraea sp. NPDC050310]